MTLWWFIRKPWCFLSLTLLSPSRCIPCFVLIFFIFSVSYFISSLLYYSPMKCCLHGPFILFWFPCFIFKSKHMELETTDRKEHAVIVFSLWVISYYVRNFTWEHLLILFSLILYIYISIFSLSIHLLKDL